MGNCASYQGDLAAALYGDLTPGERMRLDQHLAACPACRAEADALRALVALMPRTQPQFTGDLRPVLLAELSRVRTARKAAWRWAWFPAAACAALAFATLFALYNSPAPETEVANTVQDAGDVTNRASVLAHQARSLAAGRNYTAARALLEDALAERLPDAGILQLALADIEFEHGQRYAEAYGAYEILKTDYPEVWSASPPETKDRFDLLAETRDDAHRALYALDAADSFERLEQVLAQYPANQLVAARAVARMADAIGAESAPDAHVRVAALERVRERCTEPLAVAQLSIALADVYWRELRDPVHARPLYESAAGSGHVFLAQRAKSAIGELDAAGR